MQRQLADQKGSIVIKQMIEKVSAANKVGVLAGIPRSAFPRIIGSKSVDFSIACQSMGAHFWWRCDVGRGATIARLRAETGAEIQVGKQDDYITLTGGEPRKQNKIQMRHRRSNRSFYRLGSRRLCQGRDYQHCIATGTTLLNRRS